MGREGGGEGRERGVRVDSVAKELCDNGSRAAEGDGLLGCSRHCFVCLAKAKQSKEMWRRILWQTRLESDSTMGRGLMKDVVVAVAMVVALVGTVEATSQPEWKSWSIYQVFTDRFGGPDPSVSCSDLSKYCNGTWKGIEVRSTFMML